MDPEYCVSVKLLSGRGSEYTRQRGVRDVSKRIQFPERYCNIPISSASALTINKTTICQRDRN